MPYFALATNVVFNLKIRIIKTGKPYQDGIVGIVRVKHGQVFRRRCRPNCIWDAAASVKDLPKLVIFRNRVKYKRRNILILGFHPVRYNTGHIEDIYNVISFRAYAVKKKRSKFLNYV